jgi:hypothetical protein
MDIWGILLCVLSVGCTFAYLIAELLCVLSVGCTFAYLIADTFLVDILFATFVSNDSVSH